MSESHAVSGDEEINWFWEEMEGRSKSKIGNTNKKMVDLAVFEEQIKKYYGPKVS